MNCTSILYERLSGARDCLSTIEYNSWAAMSMIPCAPPSPNMVKDLPLELPWKELADPATTLVVYMGLTTLPEIAKQLMAAGLPQDTWAAAIQNGTNKNQRHCFAHIRDLPQAVLDAKFEPPVLIIIGDVVQIAHKL